MQVLLILLGILSSLPANADADKDYALKNIEAADQTMILKEKLKSGKGLCPGHPSEDKSSCLNSFLKKTKITVITELAMWSHLCIFAALMDKDRKSLPQEAIQLWLTENLLVMMERFDMRQLYLARLQSTPQLEILRRNDEKMLPNIKTKLLGMAETSLKEVSGRPLHSARVNAYRARMKALRPKPWVYDRAPAGVGN